MSSDVPGGKTTGPRTTDKGGEGQVGMQQWHTVGRAIPGGLRPRRARFRFARRDNRSKATIEEQEQTSAAAANGLAPRSIHLNPGGPILLADAGPFWLPITTAYRYGAEPGRRDDCVGCRLVLCPG